MRPPLLRFLLVPVLYIRAYTPTQFPTVPQSHSGLYFRPPVSVYYSPQTTNRPSASAAALLPSLDFSTTAVVAVAKAAAAAAVRRGASIAAVI
ncbi:hypothetical protein BZA05DRAFT_405243 [Tricharina praecox]|uniref:uncharacterized protein n=1 Tax=Tricharina praecox TaxID=43433 RepID=UPI00221EBD31|nr:uncharacterized protein BZA05DRAFT_405243 [Tricharina praecox]KAI5847574.1 hypothetical protein BZA05DRAFT_405243 [Tricharina praecox]